MVITGKERVSIPYLFRVKEQGEKITVLTAYDFPTARILDDCGIDIILVGDSVGMAVLGYETTLPVTMEVMIHHTQAVVRARRRALVVGDMPFLSFHLSLADSIFNAGRFIKEAGADAVKLEGASPRRLELVEALVEAEIPVMGHVGLTPQSIRKMGGFKVQGTEGEKAEEIYRGALALEKAGAFAVVLESVPEELAAEITKSLKIPTIGIGAGPYCDGQVLVVNDMLGYSTGYMPKFVKKYADLVEIISKAVNDYITDVRQGRFPDDEHSYHLKKEIAGYWIEKLKEKLSRTDDQSQ
ncbi:MAG TPA: 3-methyl-2-oxobutanoate hydroxymethyltransferase [Candidatus Saccharicenans sp.]|jgi:3-methyl-2-oxobutanoate hydroxymethyltransferase|nr:3-methyl-2-oxobutanoate hydroxymethyltransferase [Candidatus Saccharicenans sp.]HRD01276.1 3-methyl-2-oxobutanoate hydroxymethyltransferase [Candidatus Saccharicenans sp.]